MEREILKTLVGSRAHGTATEDSDYDYRGVFVTDAMDILSPFRDTKTSHWIEDKEDNTSYELTHFVKLCAQGNPSALELLVAPMEYYTGEGQDLRHLLPKFLSKKRCYDAFRGYAHNQEKKFRTKHLGRGFKYAEAHMRTLYQLLHLLETGELKIGWEAEILDQLRSVKRGLWSEVMCMNAIIKLEAQTEEAYEKSSVLPDEPDIEAIEKFLHDVYLKNNE